MHIEGFQIFCVTPDKCDEYRDSLFNSDEIAEPSCTMKATSHIGGHAACVAVEVFTNIVSNYVSGMEIRETPFKYCHETSMMANLEDYV